MKTRHAVLAGKIALLPLAIATIVIAAQVRARENARTAFEHYRPDWEDAWRAPVEHLAVDTLGRLLPRPDAEPEMLEAALAVMRRSQSWYAMGPEVSNQLKGWLDVRLANPTTDGDRLRPVFALLALAESEEVDAYRTKIVALAGDRTTATTALSALSARLHETAGTAEAEAVLDSLVDAWRALLGPINGARLNWLARAAPTIASSEQVAILAVANHIRQLLEPYGIKAVSSFGETLPDQAMRQWLDHQAANVNKTRPALRTAIAHAREVLAEFAPTYHYEPVIEITCLTALRHHALPWSGLAIAVLVLSGLAGGLAFCLVRLARGPLPVDVNAETMENVEPIDLDTDAETRSRSSASITDVG